jgi:hypothetical protein
MDKNSDAYKKALSEANKIYGNKSNIFRSSYIVQKYKDYGGNFKEERKQKNEELTRWYKEKWISVIPYLEKNKVIECGIGDNEGCRPLIRINKNTPITIGELLKIHKKNDILKMAYLKKMNPDIRIDWKSLSFTI